MNFAELDRSEPPSVAGAVSLCCPNREGHIFREYLHYGARATHAPPRYHLMALLPCISHMLVLQGWQIDVGEGKPKHPQVLTGLIGSSGAGKSTAGKLARKLTTKVMERLYADDPQADPFLIADGSPQGIFHALGRFWRPEIEMTPAIAWQDEFSLLLRREDFADMFCRIYDGEDLKRHLRSHQRDVKKGERREGDEDVKRPVLNGIFASTPGSLQAVVTSAQMEGGLFSRVSWIWESPDPRFMLFEVPDLTTYEAYLQQLVYAWYIGLGRERAMNPELKHTPVIRMSDAANALIREHVWNPALAEIARESRLGALFTRFTRLTKFVAGIYALAGYRFEVGLEEAHAAVHLTHALMKSVYRLDGQMATNDEARFASKIEAIVLEAGTQGLRRWELMRRLRGMPKMERDKALWALMDQQMVLEIKLPTGGREASVYVHEHWMRQRTEQNDPR